MPKNMMSKLPMPAAEVAPALVGRGQSSPTKGRVQELLAGVKARQQQKAQNDADLAAKKAMQASQIPMTNAQIALQKTAMQKAAMPASTGLTTPLPNNGGANMSSMATSPKVGVTNKVNPMGVISTPQLQGNLKKGGKVRGATPSKFSSGGSTSKASSRGDGIAQRGKTKGRYI